jgi:hypothetical protein
MTKRPAKGPQLDTIPRGSEIPQISFDLDGQDDFVQSHGVTFVHYRAMPSPIGLKDRGEYRRSDALDTISSNGFIYKKCGEFTAVMLGNSKKKVDVDGGMFDQSTSRMTLPRFYDEDSENHAGEPIYLAPGDRIYIKDMEVAVVNYQRVNHNPNGDDFLQYPAVCVEFLMDSRGIDYKHNVDFIINKHGNIEWIPGKKHPGTDEDTGTGRVYSIRYRYNAHWYIAALLNEVRVGNVTDEFGMRNPARMPYHAMIQREYVYHQKTNDGTNEKKSENPGEPSRVVPKPVENINPNKPKIKVNVNTYSDEEDGE